jgi:SAM-dependent methyltransferase
MVEHQLPSSLDELVAHQPLPHLLWRIAEWRRIVRHDLRNPLLDLGCGDGWFGRMLYVDGVPWGVDLTLPILGKARQRGVYRHVLAADAGRLPFHDATWATVVANSTLEHVVELDDALRDVRRVLQPDGWCYFTVLSESFASMLFHSTWLRRVGARRLAAVYGRWLNHRLAHFHWGDVAVWRKRLARAGLQVVRSEPLLPRSAVALWDVLLPVQYFLRRVHRLLPWYRWLRRQRRAVLVCWLHRLDMRPEEAGAVWLLVARRDEGK